VLTCIILWPGLSGPFLLDDAQNLNFLSVLISDPAASLLDLVLENPDVRGRMLAFWTFSMQMDAFSAKDPYPYKVVNLIIHCANVVLVFWLAKLVAPAKWSRREILVFSSLVAFIWAVHPIQHSTVFYIVQRMTLLSAFFVFLAAGMYCSLRQKYAASTWRELIILVFVVYSGVALGGLSKQNSLLLIFFIVALDNLLVRVGNAAPLGKKRPFYTLILGIPLACFAVIMAYKIPGLGTTYVQRDFTPMEHLLTESRVVWMYLQQIILPSLHSMGLFHDNFGKSTSLFQPVTTLFAVAGLMGLWGFAWFAKSKAPFITFGVAWYFSGHLLESTILPLELVFEHRNYVPLFGILAALAASVIQLARSAQRPLVVLFAPVLVFLVFLSVWNAKIWSSQESLVSNWALSKPDSIRAQMYLSEYWVSKDYPYEADKIYRRITEIHPRDILLRVNYMTLSCRINRDTQEQSESLINFAKSGLAHINLAAAVETLFDQILARECNSMNLDDAIKMMKNLLENPAVVDKLSVSKINLYLAKAFAAKGNAPKTQYHLTLARNARPDQLDVLQWQIAVSASLGKYEDAENFLSQLEVELEQKHYITPSMQSAFESLQRSVEARATIDLALPGKSPVSNN
jgi:hypothetical protein